MNTLFECLHEPDTKVNNHLKVFYHFEISFFQLASAIGIFALK